MIQTSLIALVAALAGAFVTAWWHDHRQKTKKVKGDRGFVEEAKSAITPENKAEYIRNVSIAMLAASTLFSSVMFVGSLVLIKQSRVLRAELQNCLTGQVLEEPALSTSDYLDDEEDD